MLKVQLIIKFQSFQESILVQILSLLEIPGKITAECIDIPAVLANARFQILLVHGVHILLSPAGCLFSGAVGFPALHLYIVITELLIHFLLYFSAERVKICQTGRIKYPCVLQ